MQAFCESEIRGFACVRSLTVKCFLHLETAEVLYGMSQNPVAYWSHKYIRFLYEFRPTDDQSLGVSGSIQDQGMSTPQPS